MQCVEDQTELVFGSNDGLLKTDGKEVIVEEYLQDPDGLSYRSYLVAYKGEILDEIMQTLELPLVDGIQSNAQ
jgi:hypothetical protein